MGVGCRVSVFVILFPLMKQPQKIDKERSCLHQALLEALRLYIQEFEGAPSVNISVVCEPPAGLVGYLAHAEISFSRRLLKHIRDSGESEVDIYKRAHVDRKLFSKIRSDPNYQPRKTTVVAFALALRLSPNQTETLLESAGYSLSRSACFDLIVRFFLERQIFDLLQVNDALFEFDQPLLTV